MDENTSFNAAQGPYNQAFNNFTAAAASDGTFVSHLDPNLSALGSGVAFGDQFEPQLNGDHGQAIALANSFPQEGDEAPTQFPRLRSQAMSTGQQMTRQTQSTGQQQFDDGTLGSTVHLPEDRTFVQQTAIQRAEQREHNAAAEEDGPGSSGAKKKETGHFSGMKKILNPPDLERWRQRLFDVDDTIVMSEEE